MDEFSQLGYFQFDNLVKNRVPFLLINLGVNLEGWYTSIYATHLENLTLTCKPEEVLQEVTRRNLPENYALVVLCEDGRISTEVAKELEAKNFLNVFILRGGLTGMKKEKA